MKKLIGMLTVIFALMPVAYGQTDTSSPGVDNKPSSTASNPPPTVGDGVRQAGSEVKKGAKKARRAVITKCADGRKTIKGQQECREGHGGVSPAN